MRFPRISASSRWLFVPLCLIGACLLTVPTSTYAQCNTGSTATGFNAIYGNCGGSTNVQAAFTLVDVTQYTTSGDICQRINAVLANYNGAAPGGVVVDARGVNPGSSSQACSMNPWNLAPAPEPPSSVVLLPSGTISITSNWTLPKNARVIGEGPGNTILAVNTGVGGFTDDGSGAMIEMGTSSICGSISDCPGISIEHLALNGNNVSAIKYGILNMYAQELSQVDDVAISSITGATIGTGISIQMLTAANSGAYTNLKMSNVKTCVSVAGTLTSPVYDTRGIHGLNCSIVSTGGPAISLDSPNSSLEDIYIIGSTSQDGIAIGVNAPAPNNVLFNIGGSGLGKLIHISNATNTVTPPSCTPYTIGSTSTTYNVCNTTILGAVNTGGTYTIADDLTSTDLTDTTVGVYILGETVPAANNSVGYSRFTTSSLQPTWLVGSSTPSGTCKAGQIYSSTSGTNTIYGCQGSGGWAVIF